MARNRARLEQKWNREFKLGAYNLVQLAIILTMSLLSKKENLQSSKALLNNANLILDRLLTLYVVQ